MLFWILLASHPLVLIHTKFPIKKKKIALNCFSHFPPFAFYSFANNSQCSHCLGDSHKNWAEFHRAVSSHPNTWGPECSLNTHYFTPINLLIHLGSFILMPGTSLNSFSQLRWPSFSNNSPLSLYSLAADLPLKKTHRCVHKMSTFYP